MLVPRLKPSEGQVCRRAPICTGSKQLALPPKGNAKWCFGKERVCGAGTPNVEMRKKPASWQKENTGVNRH